MTTNAILLRDALGQIGVLGEGEAATAEQLELGLRVMNNIMADWEAEGVGLEYYPQTQAGDDTPVPSHAISGVTGFVAAALAPYYGKQLSPEFVASNRQFYTRLERTAVKDALKPSTLDQWPNGLNYRGNIIDG